MARTVVSAVSTLVWTRVFSVKPCDDTSVGTAGTSARATFPLEPISTPGWKGGHFDRRGGHSGRQLAALEKGSDLLSNFGGDDRIPKSETR